MSTPPPQPPLLPPPPPTTAFMDPCGFNLVLRPRLYRVDELGAVCLEGENLARTRIQGGGDLVAEETCLEKFSMPNSGAIFPITFNDCGGIFPILCFGHQVQNLYPVLRGGGDYLCL